MTLLYSPCVSHNSLPQEKTAFGTAQTLIYITATPSFPKDFADYATSCWEQYCQLHEKQNICFPWQLHAVLRGITQSH